MFFFSRIANFHKTPAPVIKDSGPSFWSSIAAILALPILALALGNKKK